MLTAFIQNLRDVHDSQTFRREFKVDGQEVPQTLRTTDHTGAAGRPRYAFYRVSNTNAETGSVSIGHIRTRNAVASFYNMPGIS